MTGWQSAAPRASGGPPPTAETVWDKPALLWRVQVGKHEFLTDEHGAPRGWVSFSAAYGEATAFNRPSERGARA